MSSNIQTLSNTLTKLQVQLTCVSLYEMIIRPSSIKHMQHLYSMSALISVQQPEPDSGDAVGTSGSAQSSPLLSSPLLFCTAEGFRCDEQSPSLVQTLAATHTHPHDDVQTNTSKRLCEKKRSRTSVAATSALF